jgi:hypothetical protein
MMSAQSIFPVFVLLLAKAWTLALPDSRYLTEFLFYIKHFSDGVGWDGQHIQRRCS